MNQHTRDGGNVSFKTPKPLCEVESVTEDKLWSTARTSSGQLLDAPGRLERRHSFVGFPAMKGVVFFAFLALATTVGKFSLAYGQEMRLIRGDSGTSPLLG